MYHTLHHTLNDYLVNKEKRNYIIRSLSQRKFLDHTIIVIDLNRIRDSASTKSTRGLMYLVSDCLHKQLEDLPVAPSFGSANSSPNNLSSLVGTAKCLRSVEEDPERDARES